MDINYKLTDEIIVTSMVFSGDAVHYTVRYKDTVVKQEVPLSTFERIHKLPISTEITKEIFSNLIFSLRYKLSESDDKDKLDKLIEKYKLK